MSPGSIGREKGLSLIEVVVCMLVLGACMISGMSMTRATQAGLDAGRKVSTAAAYAQAKMEEEISLPYNELIQGEPEHQDAPEGFIRTWTIQKNAPYPRCSTVFVTVEWADSTGRTHSVALMTVRSKGVVP